MSRSILLDTETTGLDPGADRIIEIAALELLRDLPTGEKFHTLLDPERDVPEEATRVHGFSRGDLTGKPRFCDVADDLLAFIGDAPIVAHNAAFDFGFLNAELARLGLAALPSERMVCTLVLAQTRYPGLPNSLDALCRRFGIDLSARTTHNALLDCRLLADVYVELTGGRQRGLGLETRTERIGARISYTVDAGRTPRFVLPTDAERAAHAAFVARLPDPVWAKLSETA